MEKLKKMKPILDFFWIRSTVLAVLTSALPFLALAQTAVFDEYSELEVHLTPAKDTVYVLNFWATWCAPCVKELPYVIAADDYRPEVPKKVILVSLDFPEQIDSKLRPFLEKHNIDLENYVLTDPAMNDWIPMVHPDWDGAIPATVLIQGDRRNLLRTTFESEQELFDAIDRFVDRTKSESND